MLGVGSKECEVGVESHSFSARRLWPSHCEADLNKSAV